MVSLLWAVVIIFLILWLLGSTTFHLGSLVWLFLVIAVIVLIFNLITGSRSGRWATETSQERSSGLQDVPCLSDLACP